MKTEAQIREFLDEFAKQSDIFILDYLYIEDLIHKFNDENYDSNDLYEDLQQEYAFDKEIVYYGNAIKYLFKNDPSLTESLGIAHEFGYEVDKLNSEILASLLASRKADESYWENQDMIDNFLNQ